MVKKTLRDLPPERRKEIAAMGGKASKAGGFKNKELARIAGAMGGRAKAARMKNEVTSL